jgi:hypothetical protein
MIVSLPSGMEGVFQLTVIDVWTQPPEPAPPSSPIPFVQRDPERMRLINPILFEIRPAGTPPRSGSEIEEWYADIMHARECEFLAGFGRLGNPDAREFRVHVFGRDVLLSRPMRLAQCEVIPGPEVYPETEDRVLVQEMKRRNFFPEPLTPEISSRLSVPSVEIFFPRVFAHGDADAANIAEKAAQEILDVIAMHRGAHPSVIGSLVEPLGGTKIKRFIPVSSYRGNLAGGPATGEDASVVRRDLDRLRSDPSLRLQAQLYRDARRERDLRMVYFRYWGFLETVAWARNLNDAFIVEWDGTAPPGKPTKVEKSSSKALIFELLRRVVGPGTSYGWSHQSDGKRIRDLIAVWHRKRNCIAHGGFCLCYNGAGKRGNSPDYETCFSAHQDALRVGTDAVRWELEQVANAVLRYQFTTR